MIISYSFLSFQNSDTYSTSSSPSPSLPLSFPHQKTLPPISLGNRGKGKRTCASCHMYPPTCVCPRYSTFSQYCKWSAHCALREAQPCIDSPRPPHYSTHHTQDSLLSFPQQFVPSDLSLLVPDPASKELRYSSLLSSQQEKSWIIGESIALLRSIRDLKSQDKLLPPKLERQNNFFKNRT